MRRPTRIQLAALLSAFATAQASAQSVRGESAVRPAVMLLVDTSGSMERVPDDGSNPDCESCVPTCTGNPATDAANKTRWAMTVEALTGTMTNYKCEVQDRSSSPYQPSWYDYGYYLPHVDFTKDMAQEPDGILDAFRNRVKFGLMTFDGVGTTIGGATLVPYTDWLGSNNPAFLDRANGAPGMYSYGRAGRLSFPGCPTDYGINAGARGPGDHDGALIRVGKSDNLDDVTAVNDRIQASLLKVRPFGGTPIAAMLDDLKYYINGGDTESDLSKTGDPFYSCRDRTAILITDGAPDALFRDKRFNCDAPDSVVPSCAANSDPSASSSSKCECPYEPAEKIAHDLVDGTGGGKAMLKNLIVVAYNVYDKEALGILNKIGFEGTGGVPLNRGAEFEFIVEAKGQAELREALNRLLTASSEVISSRSVPVSVNTGDALLGDNSRRYDITAGYFRPKNADDPWSGLLYRQRVLCESAAGGAVAQTMDAGEGDIIHDRLNQRTTSRDLFTAKPSTYLRAGGTLLNAKYNPSASPVQTSDDTAYSSRAPSELLDLVGIRDTTAVQNHQRPDGSEFPRAPLLSLDDTIVTNHQLVDLDVDKAAFDTSLDRSYFGDADNDRVPGEAEDRDLVVNYVTGRSRPGNVMADIYHSNPTAMAPVNKASGTRLNNINSTYSAWLGSLASNDSGSHYREGGRPGMIFVGTNDGVLHAFNLEDWRDPGGGSHQGGDELWAFTPPALFGKMASMLSGHQFMFDGTPIVRDVVLQKQPKTPPMFRTILVSAVRGAPAYVALDVTFPESPQFLWQTSFGAMGNTIANPGLTQVDLTWMDETQTRAVAILPGGEGVQSESACSGGHPLERGVTRAQFPLDNTRNVRCWQQRGRSLYVVDVATGRLIQEFGSEHFPSPLTGSVVVDGLGTGSSSAAYFFDHDGVLWRLSMLSRDPSKWRVQPIYDMFAEPFDTTGAAGARPDWAAGRRPSYAPTLTYDRLGNLVVLAGTGDLDAPMDTAYQRVISLTEYRDAGLGDSEIAGTVVLNWKIDLLENESVSGPLAVLNGVTYFATFQSLADEDNQCKLGVSRVYGAHAFERKPASGDPKDWPAEPRPELVRTGGLPTDPRILSEEYDSGGSNQLIGLTITREPVCLAAGGTVRNPVLGQDMQKGANTGGGFGITAMLSGDSDRAQPTKGSRLSQMTGQHLPDQSRQSISTWASYAE